MIFLPMSLEGAIMRLNMTPSCTGCFLVNRCASTVSERLRPTMQAKWVSRKDRQHSNEQFEGRSKGRFLV